MSCIKLFSKLLPFSWVAVLLAVALHEKPAAAQMQVYVNMGVPPEVIATTAPVYYEGRPCYWYNGRWMYRYGGGWAYYQTEPVFLAQRRRVWVGGRRYYGGYGYHDWGYRERRWGRRW